MSKASRACLRQSLTVVATEDIVSALNNTLGRKGITKEDNERLAEYLMSFFGYADEIIDNQLKNGRS